MFSFGMQNWIRTEMDITEIVTLQDRWPRQYNRKSENKEFSHTSSAAAVAKQQYSASILEREIIACFFEPHVIRLPPKKIQKPEVDFRSSGSDAQLASA